MNRRLSIRRSEQHTDDLARALRQLGVDPQAFRSRLRKLIESDAPRLARLWSYYRNPTRPLAVTADATASPPYRQAQEWGLPRRITGGPSIDPSTGAATPAPRREVVVENDIAWRIDTGVDFLFGGPVRLRSRAPDPRRRATIQRVLSAILDHNGGAAFLQQLALVGAIYGHVDVLVKLLPESASDTPPAPGEQTFPVSSEDDPLNRPDGAGARNDNSPEAERLARRIRLEVVEPARALPILDEFDPRVVRAYAQVYRVARPVDPETSGSTSAGWFRRMFSAFVTDDQRMLVVELITPDRWMRFHDSRRVAEGANSLGRVPLVHVQNLAVPFAYTGAGDVEPLLPLQDELNTRLSDRAHRITMQSFRMYLGKGIDHFTEQPVAPGRMWMSESPDAQIVEFGGDSACPSEESHVREIREAMDKISGVTPIAAGILRNRIGRLTSGAALRVTLMALLARTHRKRQTYGAGLEAIAGLSLAWLDRAGVFATDANERAVEVEWFDPVALIEGACTPVTVREDPDSSASRNEKPDSTVNR